MKYAIIIPDGAADQPIPQLGGRTPLQAARMPNTARLAAMGRVGTAVTTPPNFEAGSDVCSMSLLGYDPARYHTGRAPLEAAALGLTPTPTDWIFRLNLITTSDAGDSTTGTMVDHSAGAISDPEARSLVASLDQFWRERAPDLARQFKLTPGVSYRNILVDASGTSYAHVATTPPHAVPGEPWGQHLPRATSPAGDAPAAALRTLLTLSRECLAAHEVNKSRLAAGKRPATMGWIWGGGTKPSVPTFHHRFGLRGAMITAVDLLAGISSFVGWDRLHVPGITSYHDTDYAAQGRATCRALRDYDLVCCHVEAPDEAAHQGDHQTKVASLEAIDEHVVGPVLSALEALGNSELDPAAEGWRLLIMPDHFTLCSTRKHDATPVPFLMGGSWIRSAVPRDFTEPAAAASDLRIDPGHDLMEYFLRSGLAGARARRLGA